ncbi:hypothetical protein PENPOL_c038G10244 [Penicillium polonicum]|uniref:Uncharacterized protein n=1 Tax=Penicillium polonicum TaxID=60169 RepID=A0A1V6N5E6_PENPO|nr:hypothetical protein PENPOL_c038G10244 [Penicillium polonicum]
MFRGPPSKDLASN